jgi:hypothetical protein
LREVRPRARAKEFQQYAKFLPLGNQNQGREPDVRDEAKPQNGFGCSLTGRARRGVVRVSCFFVSFLGSSVALLFAIWVAGSSAARIGNASDGLGGTHGESAYLTTVLGGGWYPASPEFAVMVGCINQ